MYLTQIHICKIVEADGTGRCLPQLICYDEFIGAGTHLLSFLSASSLQLNDAVLLWKMDFFLVLRGPKAILLLSWVFFR